MALFGKPKYTIVRVKKKEIPDGLWTKCEECSSVLYNKTLEENFNSLKKVAKGVTFNSINIFQLHPGSTIYNVVKKLGIVSDESWFGGFKMDDFIDFYYQPAFVKEIKKYVKIFNGMFASERLKKQTQYCK